jgi:hypothetical protein
MQHILEGHSVKTLVWTVLFWLQLGVAASGAEKLPCPPPLAEAVNVRLDMLVARQQLERAKEAIALQNNGILNKLLLDRLSGSYTYGKGFTVDSSIDGSATQTFVRTDKLQSAWSISYTLPLSAFTDKYITKAKVGTEVALLDEKQRLERRDEVAKINLLYGDFLEAQQKLNLLCKSERDDTCLPLVSQARKAIVSLLCLSGLKEPETCPKWESVADRYTRLLREDLSCVSSE